MSDLPTTQRAYTLRLRGLDRNDASWRDALWATHEAVNKGAKVFGAWLLTLRGGLSHKLAAEGPEVQCKDRRILLALSWLSVEDEPGASSNPSLIIAYGDGCKHRQDNQDARDRKIEDALRDILSKRGLNADEVESWVRDCEGSLKVRIRDDAVWVNRSAAFDALTKQCPSLTRDDVWDFLEPFFVNAAAYLRPSESAADDDANAAENKAKDLVQKAGGWLSKRMGTGGGADFERLSRAYQTIALWTRIATAGSCGDEAIASLARHLREKGFAPPADDAASVLSVISGPGYKSATRNQVAAINDRATVSHDDLKKLDELAQADAEASKSKIGGKGPRPYATMLLQQVEAACCFTYVQQDGPARHCEFSVMLDHAARRANVAHSWIKNAEAQRRQFETDANRLVPQVVREWLEKYCKDRGGDIGSLDAYRIRKRAIDGWDKIVDRWSLADCLSTEHRIAAARQLQDDPDIDKFGDIQLFEALADADALCVWKPDGTPTAQPLKDFVAATEAEAKRRRFKVPAYRHPDALRHPVFVDFGNSRWDIDFAAHRARQLVLKWQAALAEAEQRLSSVAESQRAAEQKKVVQCRKKLTEVEQDLKKNDDHRLELNLWNGQAVGPTSFRWSCKRLVADLALRSNEFAPQAGVSRADRLGRASVDAGQSSRVSVTGLFEQKHWNGRLQAPRAQLDAIAHHVDKHGWDAKARAMIERIRWLVSFSAELTQQGPWPEYCKLFDAGAPAKPFVSSKGEYAVKHRDNDQRKGHAKLLLSRLPGLRVLSVDLGHRYAAACAVWEALAPEAMKKEIHGRMIVAGGSGPDELYCHTRHTNSRGKERTTIYRRIGLDTLLDGCAHPAPWARLDRQFLIKLQGEDRPSRMASPGEIREVEHLEECVGRHRIHDDPPRELAVDALMSDTVRTMRLALKRHGDRARIAYAMTADYKAMPGERKYYFNKPDDASSNDDEHKRRDSYIEFLQDALALWHGLFSSWGWKDDAANALWNQHIVALHGYQAPEEIAEDVSPAERKKRRQANKDKLRPAAEALAENLQLRQQLHEEWKNRWTSDDGAPAEVNRNTGRKLQDGTGWHGRIRHLQDWLMPRRLTRMVEVTKQDGRQVKRRKPIRQAIAAASNVGGLSLTRISTLTEFRRKVQVGYFTRMQPDGSRAEIGLGFGQSTLDTLERMKDQRIKQLVSRIVEAALGIGIEQEPVWDDMKKKWREHKRPHRRSSDPRFAPCHAVIIEDLSHYRPEETRTRRENRATMDWKSAETRKRLEDHCQLYGLHLRDVNPQYTSRQDSRTGAPGVRCVDVPVIDFLTKSWWRKQVVRAQSKTDQNNKGDARDRYLLALQTRLSAASQEEKVRAAPLRITFDGGDIFVSADPRSPLAGGIQADLNAAANIGLRALMDPDFPGRWWYVPCDPATLQPKADKVKGCMLETIGSLAEVKHPDQTTPPKPKRKLSAKATKEKEVVNLWRDPAPDLLNPKSWCEYTEYLSRVRFRVIQILRARAGLPRDDGK